MAIPGVSGIGGISGALNYFSGSNKGWSGFLTSIDTIPPYFLPFSFPPRELFDDFSPEFNQVRQPAGRYSYPIYKGMGQRVITFKVGFDAAYITPGVYGGPTWDMISPTKDECDNSFSYAYPIAVVIAHLQKFKMPKTNWNLAGMWASSIMNAGLFVKPDMAEPAPPLMLLSTGVDKFYLGYMAEAKITELKHTSYMMATRIDVAIKFLVTPDMVFTTAEDIFREGLIAASNFV